MEKNKGLSAISVIIVIFILIIGAFLIINIKTKNSEEAKLKSITNNASNITNFKVEIQDSNGKINKIERKLNLVQSTNSTNGEESVMYIDLSTKEKTIVTDKTKIAVKSKNIVLDDFYNSEEYTLKKDYRQNYKYIKKENINGKDFYVVKYNAAEYIDNMMQELSIFMLDSSSRKK